MAALLEELEKKAEELPVFERMQFVEDIWDSIARTNTAMPVPQWQKDELNRRKQSYLQNPGSGQTWAQVKQEILQAS
jgi:putative addiction module component (TIGR02574 family)